MAGTCFVRLLGGFGVEIDGRRVADSGWRHRRGADLVKLLALAPRHRAHRDQVEDALWPDLPRESAAANLRKAVYFARRALGTGDAIEVDADMVLLWPNGALMVDSERFEIAARDAGRDVGAITAAAELFGGDLLPEDRFAEWTEPHRERVRSRLLELLRRAGRWEQILDLDRSNEEAHQALMRAYIDRGDRRGAIRQFARLREVLRTDLGVGPAQETVQLFEKAVAMEAAETPGPENGVQALIARALVAWNRQDLDAAEHDAEQARQMAGDYGLGPELGEASTVLGLVAWARGTWRDRFRAESIDVFGRAPEQAPFVLEGHLCLAEAALNSVESSAVAATAGELLHLAEQSGSISGEALMTLLVGETDLFSGRWDEAEQRLTRAFTLCEGLGSVSGQAFALLRLAELASAGGRLADARQLLARAWPLAERSDLAAHLLVRAYEARIRTTPGRRKPMQVVEEAERALARVRICSPCAIGFWLAASVACVRAGEIAKSRTCLREAERLAGMWQGGPWLAATWEVRATFRLAEGDRDQAAALLREAAELFTQVARPIDAARCRTAAATVRSQMAAVSR